MHELLAVNTKLARKVGEEKALDSLGLIEHVLVHPCPTEEKHVRVIGDDTLDEAELDKRCALRFRLHWGGDVRDAKQAEHHLRKKLIFGRLRTRIIRPDHDLGDHLLSDILRIAHSRFLLLVQCLDLLVDFMADNIVIFSLDLR